MMKYINVKKTSKGATHKRNPPGTKIAKRVARNLDMSYRDFGVFHGGELTAQNNERAARRLAMWGV